MKKFLLQKNSIMLFFGGLKYHGDISESTQAELAKISNDWLDFASMKENEENENKFKEILFPEFREVKVHNEKIETFEREFEHMGDDFYTENGCFYYREVNLSMPKVLAEQIKDLIAERNNDEVNRLINFWKWLSLNPSADSREDMYNWISKNKIPILPSGLILTFRRVVKVEEIEKKQYAFEEYINKEYWRLKTAKKSTRAEVYEYPNQVFSLKPVLEDVKGKFVGVVVNLFQKIQNAPETQKTYYTDNHTKTFKYYLGKENRMPRSDVDANKNNSCSKGFHSAGLNFAYSGFGDTPVACLVNPMDVIVVYSNDYGKTRSSAFTIVGILEKDAEWVDNKEILECIETNTLEQIERVNKLIKESDVQDEKKQEFLIKKEEINIDSMPNFFKIKALLN